MRIRKQLNELLSRTCMVLRKWRSNSQALLDTIPEELKETETIQLFSSPKEHHKALGVHWDTHSDCLHVATPPPSRILHPTKRQLASEIARVFDLMGWFAPAVIQLKIMLQRLWKLGLTWDIPVLDDIASAWRDWQSEQPCLSEFPVALTITRRFFSSTSTGFPTPPTLRLVVLSTSELPTLTLPSPSLYYWLRPK